MIIGIMLSTLLGPGGFFSWLAGHNGDGLEAQTILGWYLLFAAVVCGFTVLTVTRR